MNKLMLLSCSAACAFGLSAPALAAEADATTVQGVEVVGSRQVNLDQAVTGASRLGVSQLETPASVEFVSGEVIRARGDQSVQDAINRATGMTSIGSPGDGGGAVSARASPVLAQ